MQANGSGISRCLYRQQRSSSVPVQQNSSANVLNTENQSPPMAPTKVRNTAKHFDNDLLTIFFSDLRVNSVFRKADRFTDFYDCWHTFPFPFSTASCFVLFIINTS